MIGELQGFNWGVVSKIEEGEGVYLGGNCKKIFFSSVFRVKKDFDNCDCDNKIDNIVESYNKNEYGFVDHNSLGRGSAWDSGYDHYFRLN